MDEEIEETLKFIQIEEEICKKKGIEYKFECPICKGQANAIKSTYNGHLWAKCDNCDMQVIQ